jgi:hypothetical protein
MLAALQIREKLKEKSEHYRSDFEQCAAFVIYRLLRTRRAARADAATAPTRTVFFAMDTLLL